MPSVSRRLIFLMLLVPSPQEECKIDKINPLLALDRKCGLAKSPDNTLALIYLLFYSKTNSTLLTNLRISTATVD